LQAEFKARPAKSINEAGQRIEKLTGIRRSPTWWVAKSDLDTIFCLLDRW